MSIKDHRQPGLDGRHRDTNGRISEKHGNTRVDTLRSLPAGSRIEDGRNASNELALAGSV